MPLLADFTVTGIDSFLKSQEKGLNGEFVAGTASTNLYGDLTNGLAFKCLVIARGLFGPNHATPGAEPANGLDTDTLRLLDLVDYPAFYFEAEATKTGNSILFQPKYVRYAQSSALNSGSGRKHVGVVVALTEQVLDRKSAPPADNDAIALFRFDLGRLEIGKAYRHFDPEPPAGALQGQGAEPLLAGTAAQQTLPAEKDGGALPANLLAYVVESENPGIVLQAFSKAFENQSDSLRNGIVEFLRAPSKEEGEK